MAKVISAGTLPAAMLLFKVSITARKMTIHCCAVPMNARTVHTASAAFLSLSVPATPLVSDIPTSKAPRGWNRREVRDSTGSTWRLPAEPTAPAWLAVMAMMAAMSKSNTMWSSVFAAAARILSASFASRSGIRAAPISFMMCAAHGSPALAFWRKRKYR